MDCDRENDPANDKKKQKCIFLSRVLTLFIYVFLQIDWRTKKIHVSWLRVRMLYHIFNNLAEFLNGDLATKVGQGILSHDLMVRECNCYLK